MEKLKSRKFWVAVVSALLVVANDGMGWSLPSESIMTVAGIVISYLVGQSIVDAKKNDL